MLVCCTVPSCMIFQTNVGDPKPNVKWEKDGRRLRSWRRVRIQEEFGSNSLEIHESTKEDCGVYTCHATNCHGKASFSVNVYVGSDVPREKKPAAPPQTIEEPVHKQRVGGEEKEPDLDVRRRKDFLHTDDSLHLSFGKFAKFVEAGVDEDIKLGVMVTGWLHGLLKLNVLVASN